MMPEIRFQFEINGERVCVSGIEGFGVLSSNLSYVHHDPDRYEELKASAPADWSTTLEEWSSPDIGISAGGMGNDDRIYRWFSRALQVGDEIKIHVLGPGEADTPESLMGPDGPEAKKRQGGTGGLSASVW